MYFEKGDIQMQTYQNRRKAPDRAAPPAQEAAPSRSELLHLSGAGAPQPMSPQLREKFEPGFGADFANIRISRGHIPEELGVQAVAQGTDILLDEGAGMDVLGHELAHVVQQAQGRVEGGFPVVENAALEHGPVWPRGSPPRRGPRTVSAERLCPSPPCRRPPPPLSARSASISMGRSRPRRHSRQLPHPRRLPPSWQTITGTGSCLRRRSR